MTETECTPKSNSFKADSNSSKPVEPAAASAGNTSIDEKPLFAEAKLAAFASLNNECNKETIKYLQAYLDKLHWGSSLMRVDAKESGRDEDALLAFGLDFFCSLGYVCSGRVREISGIPATKWVEFNIDWKATKEKM